MILSQFKMLLKKKVHVRLIRIVLCSIIRGMNQHMYNRHIEAFSLNILLSLRVGTASLSVHQKKYQLYTGFGVK